MSKKKLIIIIVAVVLIIAVVLGVTLGLTLGKKNNGNKNLLSLKSLYDEKKESLAHSGYESYVIEDKAEIFTLLEEYGLVNYLANVNCALQLGGAFTALEMNSIDIASKFEASNITQKVSNGDSQVISTASSNGQNFQILIDKNIVTFSRYHYMRELLHSDYAINECGNYFTAKDGSKILLKATSNIIHDINVIGYRAFAGAEYLRVTADSSLKIVESQAFIANVNLEQFLVSGTNNIEFVGDMAFLNCTNLLLFEGAKVKEIGREAFAHCASMSKLTLGAVDTIGEGAFYGARKLVEIEGLRGNYFADAEAIYTADKKSLIICISNSTTFTALAETEEISYGAFSEKLNLQKVVLGNKLTKIGTKAFENCIKLSDINLDNVVEYGDEALLNTKISVIKFSNNLKKIGAYAFMKGNLSELTIPASVESIGDCAFKENSRLRKIVFESSKPFDMGEEVFNDTYRLYVVDYNLFADSWVDYEKFIYNIGDIIGDYSIRTVEGGVEIVQYLGLSSEVSIPESIGGKKVVSLGVKSFYQLHHVATLNVIGNNLVTIGDSAFDGCSNLTTITINEGVTTFGNNAFRSCPKLKNVSVPNSLTKVGSYAFDSSQWLKDQGDYAVLGNILYKYKGDALMADVQNVKYIGNRAFAENKIIKEIKLNESILGIAENAFYYCEALEKINLPEGLKVIEWQAFLGCMKLDQLTLPLSVEYIGYGCFMKPYMNKIIVLNEVPFKIAGDMFIYPQNPNFRIVVPSAAFCTSTDGVCAHSKGKNYCYKHASGWTAYRRSMEVAV